MAFEGFGDYGPELVEFQRDMFLEMIESDGMPAQTHAQGRLLFFIWPQLQLHAHAHAHARTRECPRLRSRTYVRTHIRICTYVHTTHLILILSRIFPRLDGDCSWAWFGRACTQFSQGAIGIKSARVGDKHEVSRMDGQPSTLP